MIEGVGWSFTPMETLTELAVERGRNAVSEMRERWRTRERNDRGLEEDHKAPERGGGLEGGLRQTSNK